MNDDDDVTQVATNQKSAAIFEMCKHMIKRVERKKKKVEKKCKG